jgi:putative acetyltransferase
VTTNLHIRAETSADFARVFEVEAAAFGSPIQARLVEALRIDARPNLSLVALDGDNLVGHIFFSPVEVAHGNGPPATQLSPIAVEPSHQTRGVGSRLIRAGLESCRSIGWKAVFLVGDPRYYARFGFEMANPRGFSCDGPHNPFLQVLELEPGALADERGNIAFHPAFDG